MGVLFGERLFCFNTMAKTVSKKQKPDIKIGASMIRCFDLRLERIVRL